MKVRKLKLRGFMTYKKEVSIDFTRLFDKRIFLISGPTGSGKTTIFDAIAFALYENVPREIDSNKLRSDYLTEDDPYTYVKLEFSIGDKTYLIKRVPSQRAVELKRPKNIGHRVEFYDISDGKDLISDRVPETRDMVKKIVGLDSDQFSKVMVLAQGQFQKFLESKSDEKADLLSDIFKTDKYRAIQDALKERAKTSKNKIESIDQDLNNTIAYNDSLKEIINREDIISLDFEKILKKIGEKHKEDKKTYNDLEEKESKEKSSQRKLYEKFEKAKTYNANIEKFNQSDSLVGKLLESLDKKNQEKKDLKLLDYAKNIKIYEERKDSARSDLTKIEESIKEEDLAFKKLKTSLEKMKADIERLPGLRKDLDSKKLLFKERKALRDDLEDFLKNKKDFALIKDLEKEKQVLKKDQKDLTDELESLRKSYEEKREYILGLKDSIQELDVKKRDLGDKINTLKRDEEKLSQNLAYQENIKNLEKSYKDEDEKMDEARLNKDLAYVNKLIDRLNKDGVCPVCNTKHDHKFKKHEISDLDFEKLEKNLSDLRLELEKSRALIRANQRDLATSFGYEEVKKIIKENKDLERSYGDLIKNKLESFEKEKNLLGKIQTKGKAKKEKAQIIEKSLEDLKSQLKILDSKRIAYLSQKNKMEAIDKDKLDLETKDIKKSIKDLSNFIEKTDKTRQSLEMKIAEHKSTIKILKENKEKTKENILSYEKEFDEKIKKEFKSLDTYRSYLKNEGEIESKRAENESYFKDLEREKTIRDKLLSYKDKEKIDLDLLNKNLEDLSKNLNELSKKRAESYQALKSLDLSFEKIKDIHSRYKKLRGEAVFLKVLSDLANGQTSMAENREKIDFETFVLSFYFDRVLAYANERFKKMTDGQFIMVRKSEAIDKRSKSGLDIEIFDYNTGKLRPASTLSGGESFMASLSLALGLSDEISEENGGIRIDTLFIDEGFGSLSKDYLENAIDAIEKLSKEDKFVGLISHVDELKDAVDSKIEISYDPSLGSSVKVVV